MSMKILVTPTSFLKPENAAAKAKLEADELKKENEKLKREIEILRQNLGREH